MSFVTAALRAPKYEEANHCQILGTGLVFVLEAGVSDFEDRVFSHAGAAPPRTRVWSSVRNAAALVGILACVIGVLILAAEGLSKSTDWYEPTPMNLLGP